jgi:hypothetical protein
MDFMTMGCTAMMMAATDVQRSCGTFTQVTAGVGSGTEPAEATK